MQLLGKAHSPDFWIQVRQKDCYGKFREELQQIWNTHCENVPIYALRYSDFKLFFTTGDRVQYQKTYFTRRLALASSALLSLVYPDEDKFLVRLMDEIFAICDEYTWCLPAHQKPDLATNNNAQIDLFAAETAFALSEIDALLGDRLEPLIRNRIHAELKRRIIDSMREKTFGWEKSTSNWAAVCGGSVGCTLMLQFPELYDEFSPRISKAIEGFLSGFSAEGICFEGPMYWFYGFGFFTVYADMLRTFTEGKTDYFARDKVRKISSFFHKVFLSGKAYVTFADCDKTAFYHLGLCHRLKKEYPDDVKLYMPELSHDFDSMARFCMYLRSALWYDEAIAANSKNEVIEQEFWAPEAQWLIVRRNDYGFAIKGGCNQEPHNHNDVGSFIFAKNGKQYLTDPGRAQYTRQYFDKESRYTILECSSRGHSVPIIDGQYQKFGKEFSAKDAKYENDVFSVDIAGAYGVDTLSELKRSVRLDKDKIILTDTYNYSGNCRLIERFVVTAKPVISSDNQVVIDDVKIIYDEKQCLPVIRSETRGSGEACWFVDFELKEEVREFTAIIQ